MLSERLDDLASNRGTARNKDATVFLLRGALSDTERTVRQRFVALANGHLQGFALGNIIREGFAEPLEKEQQGRLTGTAGIFIEHFDIGKFKRQVFRSVFKCGGIVRPVVRCNPDLIQIDDPASIGRPNA